MRILKGDLIRSGIAIKPELMHAMMVADQLHQQETNREAEFTHLLSGTHGSRSLHYAGLAADMRVWLLPKPRDFAARLEATLNASGHRYDVVFEGDHIHIEFQPIHLP